MKLRRLRFEAIGHRDARLAPLLLDFTGDPGTPALDTVLWLRNGGGKSSILNLFYSLLRPDRREFLGSETEGRQRRLEDYVAADDTAHVVAEWEMPGTGALPGMGEATLVTGMVLEWRDRAKSADPSRLRRAWYAFFARPGGLTLATLPFHIESERSGNGDGPGVRRSTGLTKFCDLLRDAARSDPALELSISDAQGEWQRRLTDLGLDPELYRYQLRMNRREGGAAELFRFRDASEFVDFLIELVVDPTEPGQVAANLSAYADELARRPVLELERDFVDGSLGHLRVLVEALTQRAATLDRLTEVWRAEDARRQSFEVAARIARQHAMDLAEEAARQQAASKDHDRQRGRLNEQAAEMRRVAADLRLDLARSLLEGAGRREVAASQHVEAWAAAELLARRRAASEQLAALDAELARIEHATAPLRAERAAAGRDLAARLEALRSAASQTADGEAAEAARAEDLARKCNERRVIAEVDKQATDSQLADIARRRNEAEAERRSLESAGSVLPGEPPDAALLRITGEERDLAREQTEGELRQAAIAAARDDLREERVALTRELTRREGAHEALAGRVDALLARVEELGHSPRLLELSEAEEIDLWNAAPGLAERLSRLIERADTDLVALEIGGLQDRRALAALEETGLLPPLLDVDKILAALDAAGIPAASGWRHLAESIPGSRRDEAIERSPELASGIVVVPRSLPAARQALDAAGLVLSTAVTIGDARSFEEGSAADCERFVLAPARALYDPGAAEAERAARVIEVESLDVRRSRLRQGREADAALREDLRRFLEEFPEGTLESWQRDLQRIEDEEASLRQRIARVSQEDAELGFELAGVQVRLQECQQRRRAIAELSPRLQACVRHIAEVEALAPEEQRLRKRREDLVADIELAVTEERDWRLRRAEAERRRADSAASAERLGDERSRIELEGAPRSDPPPEHTLDGLRARYRALEERYRGIVGNNVLADRRSSAARELASLDRQLSDEPMASRIPAAEEILAASANAEAGQRASGQHRAEAARDAAIAARARAEAGVEQAERDVRSLAPSDGRRIELSEELRTQDPVEAQGWAERLAADASAASERATAADKAAATAERESDGAGREAERMTGLASRLSTALVLHRQSIGPAAEAAGERSVWPFDHGYEEAYRLTEEALQLLEDAGAANSKATRQAATLADVVRRFALSERFGDLKGKVKDRLVLDDLDTLAERAPEHVASLDMRLAQLTAQLASLAEHQRLVVSALVGIVETALSHLRRAESSSRLPEALEGWAGRPFIKIAFDTPERDEELFGHLGAVVDRVVAEGNTPEGLPLLLRATRAAVGRRGFEVTILKPDTVLRPDRHPVTELNKFSDGEKLTATILLYCTLARLRARNRGRPDTGGGMLILDNPIGTCSNVGLLNLQRQVAVAMGVQLIYTTGVNDLDALATLPNCIRLRNNHRDQRTGRLHVLVEPGDLPATSVAATRVFWRGPARTP